MLFFTRPLCKMRDGLFASKCYVGVFLGGPIWPGLQVSPSSVFCLGFFICTSFMECHPFFSSAKRQLLVRTLSLPSFSVRKKCLNCYRIKMSKIISDIQLPVSVGTFFILYVDICSLVLATYIFATLVIKYRYRSELYCTTLFFVFIHIHKSHCFGSVRSGFNVDS